MEVGSTTKCPHPGVVLIRPDPAGDHPTWRPRHEDPDTRRITKERLDPVTLGTAEARRDWDPQIEGAHLPAVRARGGRAPEDRNLARRRDRHFFQGQPRGSSN
jgi:hypothetical protein